MTDKLLSAADVEARGGSLGLLKPGVEKDGSLRTCRRSVKEGYLGEWLTCDIGGRCGGSNGFGGLELGL